MPLQRLAGEVGLVKISMFLSCSSNASFSVSLKLMQKSRDFEAETV